tara:strand:- start:3622 stop:3945 length:324 start_codon:yes stop_codon:yes gene_type:complete
MDKVKMVRPMSAITRELIKHMKDEKYLDRVNTTKLAVDGNIHYDRGNFVKSFDDVEGYDSVYERDIETLSIQILQMIHYGYIIYETENGNLIRHANKYLTEKNPINY